MKDITEIINDDYQCPDITHIIFDDDIKYLLSNFASRTTNEQWSIRLSFGLIQAEPV